jgi:hypothetical protein
MMYLKKYLQKVVAAGKSMFNKKCRKKIYTIPEDMLFV